MITVFNATRLADGALRFTALTPIGRVSNCIARRQGPSWRIFGPGFRTHDGKWIELVIFSAAARDEMLAELNSASTEVAA